LLLWQGSARPARHIRTATGRRCRSSVVEHSLGKGEVVSSILTGSTSESPASRHFSASAAFHRRTACQPCTPAIEGGMTMSSEPEISGPELEAAAAAVLPDHPDRGHRLDALIAAGILALDPATTDTQAHAAALSLLNRALKAAAAARAGADRVPAYGMP